MSQQQSTFHQLAQPITAQLFQNAEYWGLCSGRTGSIGVSDSYQTRCNSDFVLMTWMWAQSVKRSVLGTPKPPPDPLHPYPCVNSKLCRSNKCAAAALILSMLQQQKSVSWRIRNECLIIKWFRVSLLLDLHRLMSPTLDNKNSNQSVSSGFISTRCCYKTPEIGCTWFTFTIKTSWRYYAVCVKKKPKHLADEGGFTRLHQNGGWHYPRSDTKHTRSPTFCLCSETKPLTSRSY